MDTENYLQIMIDSLVQKEELLKQIVDYNEKQQAIITAAEFDEDAFEQNKYKDNYNLSKLAGNRSS